MFDTTVPIQMTVNVLWRKGAQAEPVVRKTAGWAISDLYRYRGCGVKRAIIGPFSKPILWARVPLRLAPSEAYCPGTGKE